MVGPRRVLTQEDIMGRGFGEGVYSTKSPEQRANEILAKDLVDLQYAVVNRKNKMAPIRPAEFGGSFNST